MSPTNESGRSTSAKAGLRRELGSMLARSLRFAASQRTPDQYPPPTARVPMEAHPAQESVHASRRERRMVMAFIEMKPAETLPLSVGSVAAQLVLNLAWFNILAAIMIRRDWVEPRASLFIREENGGEMGGKRLSFLKNEDIFEESEDILERDEIISAWGEIILRRPENSFLRTGIILAQTEIILERMDHRLEPNDSSLAKMSPILGGMTSVWAGM